MTNTAASQAQSQLRVRTRLAWARLFRAITRHVPALILATIFFVPFLWTIFSSLKAGHEIYVFPPTWLPETPQWSNYVAVWQQVPFARFLLNTVMITVASLIGQVATATLVAYGFARFKFPGRDFLFMLVLATLMLPAQVTLIPRFILFRILGWLDTFLPLTVPSYFGGGAYFIFLLRQFMMTLPVELDEAAELDGANSLRILVNILVPLMKPALATVAIFSFMGSWNDFINPLIYLRSTEKYTLQLGLRFFQQAAETGGAPREPFMMAASLMVAAPCILLFFIAQRYFVRGIVMSGLKY